jgi:tetratricopeptide (TPR) repeat protein
MINGNWGIALERCGHLDAARQRQIEAAEAFRNADDPEIEVIGRELEVARIDIAQGAGAAALPCVEARLERLNSWWEQYRSNNPVPDVSWEPDKVNHVLVRALQILAEERTITRDWLSAVRNYDLIIRLKKERGSPEVEIGFSRASRANVLRQLGRYPEAKRELEDCLDVFRNDPTTSALVLSSLGDLFAGMGDQAQAIAQHRRALVVLDQSPNPIDRATVHGNIALCLEKSGTALAFAEASSHALAALLFRLVAGSEPNSLISANNYIVAFRSAHAAGTELIVPRVAELLADPAFYPLEQWLRQRQFNVEELQVAVDYFMGEARQVALRELAHQSFSDADAH